MAFPRGDLGAWKLWLHVKIDPHCRKNEKTLRSRHGQRSPQFSRKLPCLTGSVADC